MKTHRLMLSTALAVLFLGIATSQFAQDPPQNPAQDRERSEQEIRHRPIVVGIMRTINTAEVGERSNYGAYASWETLLAHQSEYLNGWLKTYHPEYPHFADLPEILPGCSVRLNVHADGQGYDIRLQDTTEKKSGYAAFADESGVIYEGAPLR